MTDHPQRTLHIVERETPPVIVEYALFSVAGDTFEYFRIPDLPKTEVS